MIAPADLERAVQGFWSVHPSGTSYLGRHHFRRRPKCHIAFQGPEWRLYETGWGWRLKHAIGTSQGRWQIIDLDGRALLVLTVLSYRPSAVSQAVLESNYGYSGGAGIVMAAGTAHSEEAQKMLSGGGPHVFSACAPSASRNHHGLAQQWKESATAKVGARPHPGCRLTSQHSASQEFSYPPGMPYSGSFVGSVREQEARARCGPDRVNLRESR